MRPLEAVTPTTLSPHGSRLTGVRKLTVSGSKQAAGKTGGNTVGGFKEYLKVFMFAIIGGWGVWTAITVIVCHFLGSSFGTTYMTVGVVYASLILLLLIRLRR